VKLYSVQSGPEPSSPARTVVLLHGYGAEEQDLVPLAAELDPSLSVVSLRGPYSLGGRMRAWYHLQQTREGFRYDAAEVQGSVLQVREAVEELAAARGKLLLLGFSQGASIAIRTALALPQHLRGLVSLSGVPARATAAERAPAEALRGLRAFAAHGLHDPLLPIEAGRETRAELEGSGLSVEYHEYPMGHAIVEEELADLRRWLGELP
jgi:phospholipase/carboxylesterase